MTFLIILTIQPGANLNVNGNLDVGQGNSGTMIINGGTCNVSGNIEGLFGSSVQLIKGGIMNDNE